MTTNNPASGNDLGLTEEEFLARIRELTPLRLWLLTKTFEKLAAGKKVQMWRFKKELAKIAEYEAAHPEECKAGDAAQ